MQGKRKKELLVKEYHSNHHTCPKCFHMAHYIDCSACEPIEETLQGNNDAVCLYTIDKDQRCGWKGKVKDLLPENLEAPPTEEELKTAEYHSNHKTCPSCKRKNSIFYNLQKLNFDENTKKLDDKWCCCISCEWHGLVNDLIK